MDIRQILLYLGLSWLIAHSAAAETKSLNEELMCPSSAAVGNPLPLAGHWNVSDDGFSPAWQLAMIKRGAPLLPWFPMPDPESTKGDSPDKAEKWIAKYGPVVAEFAKLGLPLSFIGTQWEHLLSDDDVYYKRTGDSNPNVVRASGEILKKVSPFGPVDLWTEVGERWTKTATFEKIQELYPNPPCVIFISNNEHPRLRWHEAETDTHFIEKYGFGRDDEFKRKVFGDGWIERYRAMQEGMRRGLSRSTWQEKSYFVGYNAFILPELGRWPGWINYSLITPGRIDPNIYMWDGGSPSYYTHNWDTSTDYTVVSSQIQSMNWPFMLREAKRVNPKYWFEFSIWDGYVAGQPDSKRKMYLDQGQTYNPDRYVGWAEFGLWLLRPRVIREFRSWSERLIDSENYFLALLKSLTRIKESAELSDFWKSGRLVANRTSTNPFGYSLSQEIAQTERWFLLETDRDPPQPWKYETRLPVYALAIENGERPNRSWMVYAHAPLHKQVKVRVSIPEFGDVLLDVGENGVRKIVNESGSDMGRKK